MLITAKEDDGPFAWRFVSANTLNDRVGKQLLCSGEKTFETSSTYEGGPKWCEVLPHELLSQPSVRSALVEATSTDAITFKLPKLNALAGDVLRHSICVVETVFGKYSPVIFKLGYTHSPAWRWGNDVYGYQNSKDKWEHMIIYYISSEPYGPAMLESALIEKFRGA